MNNRDDNSEWTEDRLIESLLDSLNQSVMPGSTADGAESGAMLREYTELLGLFPYEIAPVAPSDRVKSQLLTAMRREQPVDRAADDSAAVAARSTSRWPRWALPIAATVAITLLGFSGLQFVRLEEQRGTIDRLAGQLSETNIQGAQLAQYQEDLARMQEQLKLVTSKGVEVCTLRPQIEAAVETDARGTLFVASDRQRWYLRIDDLEPCPQGRSYQLWFVTADGTAVDGGVLDIEHGVHLEITSDRMPDGTVAVNITLEPAGGSSEPSGPSILYGDDVMRIL